jgi:YidC/Oxa1 family membrane protein insertase
MMEKRTLLAAVLMALVLFAYLWVQETFFAPPPRPAGEPPTSAEKAPPATPAPAPAPAQPPAPKAAAPVPEKPRPPQRIASVESPLYRGAVSSEGGKLQEWTLQYRGEKPVVVIGEFGPTGLVVGEASADAALPMQISPDGLKLDRSRPSGELTLEGMADGLVVRQTLQFQAATYTIDARIRVENTGSSPRAVTVALPWVGRHHAKPPTEKFPGQHPTEVVWATAGHVERIEELTAVGARQIEGDWIAIGSTWYLAALMPQGPGFKLVTSDVRKGDGDVQVTIAARATPTIAPGQAWEGHVRMYAGPKEHDRLRAHGLEGTLNFGGFPLPRKYGGLPMEWLGVPILRFMNWVHDYLPNYGVVIIVLTVLSKVLFYPLTVKSIRSMKAMQTLQPQINALRSKYKNDARKLQEETLALYRKHRVNPMGGCLPMAAQIPIFYALYLALSVSVELQNAPFLCFGRLFGVDLWICDLAAHDPTYVLPILMGASMFVQQKMTPTMGDPRQAKMMLVMPFIFTFMFLNLPSGLVLYWFVSNVLQIAQQWYMDRSSSGPAREAKDVARA